MNEMTTDVVVVAGGPAGLCAAIEAADAGAKVLLFEKGSTTGGAANMGMGPLGIESRLQRLKQHGPTKDEAFKTFMDYTHWRVDARLVRAYIDKAATSIDWLERLGVEFVEPAAYFPGGNFTWHIVKAGTGAPGPMAAGAMIRVLTEKAKEKGVRILLQTPVRRILREDDRIVGVVAEDASGEEIQVNAKAVIVCTGGFGNNPEMIKKYTGYDWGKDLSSFRIPGVDGDGLRMAWEVGAAPTEITMELIYMMPGEFDPVIGETFRQPHLMVNLLGERFMNEEIMPNTTFTGNAISRQKNRTAFIIFDEEIKERMEKVGFDLIGVVFPVTEARNFDALLQAHFDRGFKEAFVADSLEELAAKTGIDEEGLRATVEHYNRCCEKGHDDLFNKRYEFLRPIKTPRFYAGRFLPGAYGSVGGIKINHRTEVLNKQWKKIPGFYAAGTDACSIYGDSYVFILPGNTMGFAINSGRIAGENAAAYVKEGGR
jgi:fumarate reductase flavoprotein subunit